MPIVGPNSLPSLAQYGLPVDVEKVVCDWLLEALEGSAEVGLVVPEVDEIRDHLPFVRVTRRGGVGDMLDRFDHPGIDLEIFHATNAAVNHFAAAVRRAMAAMRWYRHISENANVTEVREAEGPQRLPWEDPDIKRLIIQYELTVRPLD